MIFSSYDEEDIYVSSTLIGFLIYKLFYRFANIPYEEITGFRAPDLMFTENMFKVLYTSNFTYDLSWPVNANFDGRDPMYPYTLDYQSTEPCPTQEQPCPKMSYPGLWEIPNINIMNKDNTTCASMMDGCDPAGNATAWYDRLVNNFHYHYNTNRSPFGMHMHVTFFLSALGNDHMVAAKKFLKYAEDLGDVWILTPSQVIAWMKDPQNDEQAKSFAPWKCPDRPKPRCDLSTVNRCHYTVKGEQVYLITCTKCPPHYPTPTNPDGN